MNQILKKLQEICGQTSCQYLGCKNKADLGYQSCKDHRKFYLCKHCNYNEASVGINGENVCQYCLMKGLKPA